MSLAAPHGDRSIRQQPLDPVVLMAGVGSTSTTGDIDAEPSDETTGLPEEEVSCQGAIRDVSAPLSWNSGVSQLRPGKSGRAAPTPTPTSRGANFWEDAPHTTPRRATPRRTNFANHSKLRLGPVAAGGRLWPLTGGWGLA